MVRFIVRKRNIYVYKIYTQNIYKTCEDFFYNNMSKDNIINKIQLFSNLLEY